MTYPQRCFRQTDTSTAVYNISVGFFVGYLTTLSVSSSYGVRRGTRYRSWLRHYATSRKVAGSIPDELTGFFNCPNPSIRTMALGSTQSLIFFILWGGTKSLGTAATSGLLYKPQMIDEGDRGATGGMKIGRGNRSTRRKPAPAPLCPPQIPHDQTRARTRAAAVGSQRLTA
jgi:hypothetical protein